MLVSSILSALTDTSAAGVALARAAARVAPSDSRPISTEYVPPVGCTCGQTPCQCHTSEFPTDDHLELSPAAELSVESELTPEEQQQLEDLKARDAEVREHEQAHLRAAGQYAHGGASYEFEVGPDGRQYAVGGEVQIDTATVPNDTDATVRKMETVRRAALAPANPSDKDRQVAAVATQRINEAQVQKRAEQTGAGAGASAEERIARTARTAHAYNAAGRPAAHSVSDRLDIRA